MTKNKSREKRIKEIRRKRKRNRRAKIVLSGAIILAVVYIGLTYITKVRERSYQAYKVVSSHEYIDDMATGFLPYGDGIVRYNRNGVIAYDRDAKPIWNAAYEMHKPIADVCKDYVVIADQGNKLINIFNKKGSGESITTVGNILKVQVAQQGVVAVLSEGDDSNYINLYSKDGSQLVDAKVTNVSEEGYPIDISLSDDGKKLVVSYITVNQGEIISYLAFYNFGEVGKNEPGRLVAGVPYKDVVIPRVAFLNNDYVSVYKEDSVILFSMEEIPEQIMDEKYEGKIKSLVYGEKYFGLVLEDRKTLQKKILLYNLKGNKVLEKDIDFNYDKIYLFGEEVILHSNLTTKIINVNGSEKFSYTFSNNVSAIYPINKTDRYFVVGGDRISSIQLIN